MQARKMLFAAIPSICALSSNKISIYFELALSFLRLILQAKGLYLTEGDSWLRAFPHFEETLLSVSEDRGSVASTPVEGEGWTSFEERVLLEPAGARFVVLLSQWAALPHGGGRLRPNLCRSKFGSRRTYKKKRELHTLVREQLRHFCEQGGPKSSFYSEERNSVYSQAADNIISSLEIGGTISEHGDWITHLKTHPKTLDGLYRDYRIKK